MEENVRIRIEALFSGRKIDTVLEQSKIKQKGNFLKALIELQAAIYRLDHYLETTWDTSVVELQMYWDDIYRQFPAFNIDQSKAREMCWEIFRYQQNELATRSGRSAAEFPMHDFYYYKTCDVRLIRRLLYRSDPGLFNWIPFSDWEPYDLITEVLDDAEDLLEDIGTYNVNRLAASLDANDPMYTRTAYVKFLGLCLAQAKTNMIPEEWLVKAYEMTLNEIDRQIGIWQHEQRIS